jgi:UDP-N-acetylglucosamine 4-epimerase
MSEYEKITAALRAGPRRWLVTGVAGFIGSNLLEALLKLGQEVVGLDNFSTGHRRNLEQVQELVSAEEWNRFSMIEGDVADQKVCDAAVPGVDYILHEAAMASVPQSLEEPLACHNANVTGFLNLLIAAHAAGVQRVVYATSCAVYGDQPELPKTETSPTRCLSPYALTKLMDEYYGDLWERCYGLETVGLRYFNVFGPRQDPEGAYAAVIPKWIAAMLQGKDVVVNGDGESTRDFCYIANVIEANLLAALSTREGVTGQVYNIAVGRRTSLNSLFAALRDRLGFQRPALADLKPVYRDFRVGDVRHSEASIAKAEAQLGYHPLFQMEDGLDAALEWYLRNLGTDHDNPSRSEASRVLA